MKTCQTREMCKEFLDAVGQLVQDLRATNTTRPTDAEGYCEMAQNCGSIGWAVFHGAAAAFRQHVCESCGKDAESLLRAAHDLVNTKLGKPLHATEDLEHWVSVLRSAGKVVAGTFQAERNTEMAGVAKSLPWSQDRESVWALMELPEGGVRRYLVASGSVGQAPLPTVPLLNVAKAAGVRALWLAHNHPSGSRSPSLEDVATTHRVAEMAKAQGVLLRDHLIVAGDQVVSIMAAKAPAAVCDCPLNLRVAQVSLAQRQRRQELGRQLQLSLFGEARGELEGVREPKGGGNQRIIAGPVQSKHSTGIFRLVKSGRVWEIQVDYGKGEGWIVFDRMGQVHERRALAKWGRLMVTIDGGDAQLGGVQDSGKAIGLKGRFFQTTDCTEMRLPLEAVEVHPESYQYRRGGSEQAGLDPGHVKDLFENFDPNRFDPIVVRRTEDGRFELLSGHHRLAAFQMAGDRGGFPTAPEYDFATIPALVRTVSLEVAQQLARLSNASIKEYKPSELARVFRIEAEAGLTPDQIGKMYGSRRPGEVQQYLDISLLPPDLQELLDVAEIRKSFSVAHAAVLGRAMRVYQIGPGTVRQIFDRVLKEREYTAAQLEKLVATFGPQLREVQLELLPGEELTGGLTGILGLIRKAMDSIRDLGRKRRLLNCVSRLVKEKEEAGERVSAELRRAREQALQETENLDEEIEAVRDRLGIAIRKQPGTPAPEPEAEPERVVIPREQIALADPRARPDALRIIADGLERRSGTFKNSPAVGQGGPPCPVPTLGAAQGVPACRGAQVRKLERCIRQVKAKGDAANPWAVCQASIGCRQSRPPRQMQAQDHETGHALCATADGHTVHGPEAHGDHDHVDIPLTCPAGSKPYGTFHTHPDGQAQPSDADVREGCRLGLKVLCVGNGQRVSCTTPRCGT